MVEKEYGKFTLVCDECGRCVSEFDTFQDALDYSDDMDWVKRMVDGEWENYCGECLDW